MFQNLIASVLPPPPPPPPPALLPLCSQAASTGRAAAAAPSCRKLRRDRPDLLPIAGLLCSDTSQRFDGAQCCSRGEAAAFRLSGKRPGQQALRPFPRPRESFVELRNRVSSCTVGP